MNPTYNGDVSLEARVRVLEALMSEREKTVALTAELMNERLKYLNELRGDVMTRKEYDSKHELMADKISNLGRLGVVLLVSVIAALVTTVFSLLKHP